MARFHFHTQNGRAHRDEEGTELKSHWHARSEALQTLGQTIIEEAKEGGLSDGLHMQVTDANGTRLYDVDLEITESPLVTKERRGLAQWPPSQAR